MTFAAEQVIDRQHVGQDLEQVRRVRDPLGQQAAEQRAVGVAQRELGRIALRRTAGLRARAAPSSPCRPAPRREISTGAESAPAGTVSVWGPMTSVPPAASDRLLAGGIGQRIAGEQAAADRACRASRLRPVARRCRPRRDRSDRLRRCSSRVRARRRERWRRGTKGVSWLRSGTRCRSCAGTAANILAACTPDAQTEPRSNFGRWTRKLRACRPPGSASSIPGSSVSGCDFETGRCFETALQCRELGPVFKTFEPFDSGHPACTLGAPRQPLHRWRFRIG